MRINGVLSFGASAVALLLSSVAVHASEGGHAAWQRSAGNEVANLPSLQRGARNFMAYCAGCHSLQYMRYSRLATDLKIPDEQRDAYIVPPNAKFSDYIKTSMPAGDAAEWFGKAPPDLSLITRSRGTDYVFNFLTTRACKVCSGSSLQTRKRTAKSRRRPITAMIRRLTAATRTVRSSPEFRAA
jgi:cytochrome c1